MFFTLISVVIIIVSILLIFTVLVQNSKGGGLAANFTSGNQTFGVRQTADFLEKATWTLIAALFFFCIVATAAIPRANINEAQRSAAQKHLQTIPTIENLPALPSNAPTAPVIGNTDNQTDNNTENQQ